MIRGVSGRVWVDDEDEFADHRVRFGYPAGVVTAALAACGHVHEAVTAPDRSLHRGASARWLGLVGSGGLEGL